MQKLFFEKRKKEILEQCNQEAHLVTAFINFLRFGDMASLKTCSEFKQIAQTACKRLSTNEIFLNIALFCVQKNRLESLQFLIEDCQLAGLLQCELKGVTLFLEACVRGHATIIEYLLNSPHPFNIECASDNWKLPALHYIAANDNLAHLIKKVAARGANLNIKSKEGFTPLHWAAINRCQKTMDELRKAKADLGALYLDKDYKQLHRLAQQGAFTTTFGLVLQDLPYSQEDELNFHAYSLFLATEVSSKKTQRLINTIEQKTGKFDLKRSLVLAELMYLTITDMGQIIKQLNKYVLADRITEEDVVRVYLYLTKYCFYIEDIKNIELLLTTGLARLKQLPPTTIDCQAFCVEFGLKANLYGYGGLAEQFARIGLQATNQTPLFTPTLYGMLGVSLHSQMRYRDAVLAFKKAIELEANSNRYTESFLLCCVQGDILSEFIDTAQKLLQGAPQTPRTVVFCLYINYYQKALTAKEVLKDLPTVHDDETRYMVLELLSDCYYELGNADLAIKYAKEYFELTSKKLPGGFNDDFNVARFIRFYLHFGHYAEAHKTLRKYTSRQPIKPHTHPLLKVLAVITYMANDLFQDAESILAELQSCEVYQTLLAQMCMYYALNLISIESKDYEKSLRQIDLALKIQPDNEQALLFKNMIASMANPQACENKDLEPELFNTIIIQHDLATNVTLPATENNQADNQAEHKDVTIKKEAGISDSAITQAQKTSKYDPTKVHSYIQKQKKILLSQITQNIKPSSVKSSWQIKGALFNETDAQVKSLLSNLYPDYFATIATDLKLDTTQQQRFEMALAKGLCKRPLEQNGIKIINNCVIELKINDDIRLYTQTIYQNPQGTKLIIFDCIGNHQVIQRISRDRQPLTIVACESKKDATATATNPNNFFHRVIKKEDEQTVDKNKMTLSG